MNKLVILLLALAVLGLAAIADPGPRRMTRPASTGVASVPSR
jgi:hypothetical protein